MAPTLTSTERPVAARCCGSPRPARSTTASPPWSGGCCYDSKSVLTDTLDAVEKVSKRKGLASADLSLLVDGLRAEREQGITIDVAYRYFATPARKFILADSPGHVQYTRNTVTGSSTADVVVMLVDARNGVVEQTRRHRPWPRCSGCRTWCWRSTRSTWSTTPRSVFTEIADRVRPAGPQPQRARHPLHPGVGDRGRQRGGPVDADALVRRADRARLPRDGGRHSLDDVRRAALPGAAGGAAADRGAGPLGLPYARSVRRLPRLRRSDRLRSGSGRGRGHRPPPWLAHHRGRYRHPGRRPGSRGRRPVGDPAAGRRHRRVARRPDRVHRRPAGARTRGGRHGVLARRPGAHGRCTGAGPARHLADQGADPFDRGQAGPRRSTASTRSGWTATAWR